MGNNNLSSGTDNKAVNSSPKRAPGNEIRSSLPPYIQERIKKSQEKRRRMVIDPKSGMIHGINKTKFNPLNWVRRLFKDR